MLGLVLTAGGARGAYQAGVLKRLGEIPRLQHQPVPFQVITGASAGAINGASLASGTGTLGEVTTRLTALWSNLRVKDVFKTDPLSLTARSAGWLHDLSLGGLWGGSGAQSLLDFSPLRHYLSQNLELSGIARSIENGSLYALAISATNYYSGKSYTFIQGKSGHPLWEKSRRVSLAVQMEIDHIWASCAIPVVFQPVLVKSKVGDYYYGDGGLRLTNPLSPAIRLGADRIFAIGIRSQKFSETRLKSELTEEGSEGNGLTFKMKRPPLAQVFGVALNSIFLDHLDTDVEHLKRMNDLLISNKIDSENLQTKEPMRVISPWIVNPSVDLASVAQQHDRWMPGFVRYLMEGLGTSKAQSADLLSYLLFDSHYTKALIEIGYQDASENVDELESFLCSSG
jgi:NTE family protein